MGIKLHVKFEIRSNYYPIVPGVYLRFTDSEIVQLVTDSLAEEINRRVNYPI